MSVNFGENSSKSCLEKKFQSPCATVIVFIMDPEYGSGKDGNRLPMI
jgi:hypothetical protein